MGFFSNLFETKIVPVVIIRNILGEPLAEIPGRDLSHANLKGLNLAHADLSKCSLFGANLEGTNLFGARLDGADLSYCNARGAEFSYSYAAGVSFRHCDLRGAKAWMAQIGWPKQPGHVPRADFKGALIDADSDIAEHKVFAGERRWNS